MVKNIKTGTRKYRTTDEKAAILKEHIVDKLPVSDICDKHDLQPSVFYTWMRQLLENMPAALEAENKKVDTKAAHLQREVDALKTKLAKKDNVIAEISEELVEAKKATGER